MTEEQRGIKRVQLAGYSGYGKQEHRKCKKPEKYGIMRTRDADRAFNGLPPKTPQKEARKFPHRLYLRLPDNEYEELQQAFRRIGCYSTMQDFLRAAVMASIRRLKEYENEQG